VSEAWADEQPLLRQIPERVRLRYAAGELVALPSSENLALQRALGEVLQLRDLREYEAVGQ
jgi:hypothetical protein